MQEKDNHIEIGPLIKIVSHDLRGPLGNLKSVVTLFKSGELPMEQAKEFMNHIELGVDKSIEMLDGLLEWSTASSSKLELTAININEIIREILDKFSHEIEQKGIKIEFDDSASYDVLFGKSAMRVILRNIISNAIKFTPNDGMIRLNLAPNADELVITISDTGVGIPIEMRETLFKMNKDNRRLGTNNEKGAGLGLFMCYDLILKNKSRISVQDNNDGLGSAFCFTAVRANID